MRFWEGIRLALQQIRAQKLKSFFSLLGIIIGITFLIAVITIVEGMNSYVRDDFASSIFGVNTFTVVRRQQVATGRIDELRREIGVEVGEGSDASTKGKIVASLKGKAGTGDTASADADAQVSTTAKTRGKSKSGR